ncbi:hypothetical protein GCM10009789_05500 [Kribbella sancticallisti]|uniref:Lipoprotein LpqN n=1 Tax=Kribbella sancticallisti TaxID=460087 RepID=A0ABN2CBN2_9ACTN
MKTPVLVCGVVFLGLVGGAAGYEAGVLTQPSITSPLGTAVPLAAATPSVSPHRKTPEPYPLPAFTTAGLRFHDVDFTVQGTTGGQTRLSVRAPRGWQLVRATERPEEVKFLDPLRERGIRVESGFPPALTTTEARLKLVRELQESQPYENNLHISSQGEDVVIGEDGEPRTVSTLIYTYIPTKTLRYVIVRWVATGPDQRATVEMSITGLPQDAKGLAAVVAEASRTVELRN